jgi:L-ascorbate metabolism protein UlaG (beta-lactamase superfamily)
MKFVAACLAFLAFVAAARADDSIATANGALIVHPIHHASLMLAWNGKRVLVDPAPAGEGDPAAAYRTLPAPDLILITHIHGDHFNVPILETVSGTTAQIIAPQNVFGAMPQDLQAKTTVLHNGDRFTARGIPVEAVAMYNITAERLKFHPKGLGNGYVLTFGGKRVYIAGDTEEVPELAHLADIDVAFVPMNLPYTETVEAAAQWIKDFRPKIVYPYHYHNADGTLSDVAKFKVLVGDASEVRLRDWY